MANHKQAEAAPAAVTVTDDAAAVEQRKREDEARRVKPVQVAPPPPAPGMAQQEDGARMNNPQAAAWFSEPVRAAWLTTAAADTKAAVLAEIAQGMLARFNADTALAAGGAVTAEWISGQVLTYQLPITEDDVRQATTAAFGEAGIQVQG